MIFKEIPSTDRESWLKWRHGGIGSSDAGVIMGVSRFKTREQLVLEKAGVCQPEDTSNSYIKNRGNRIEALVRTYLEEKMNTTLSAVSGERNNFPFIRASLDGASPDRKIITEIKLLSSQKPDKINTQSDGYKKWEAARLRDEVPEEYWPQIQHQLFVTGADFCVFAGLKETKGEYYVGAHNVALVDVYPNREYREQLINEEVKFWLEVESKMIYNGELE